MDHNNLDVPRCTLTLVLNSLGQIIEAQTTTYDVDNDDGYLVTPLDADLVWNLPWGDQADALRHHALDVWRHRSQQPQLF